MSVGSLNLVWIVANLTDNFMDQLMNYMEKFEQRSYGYLNRIELINRC